MGRGFVRKPFSRRRVWLKIPKFRAREPSGTSGERPFFRGLVSFGNLGHAGSLPRPWGTVRLLELSGKKVELLSEIKFTQRYWSHTLLLVWDSLTLVEPQKAGGPCPKKVSEQGWRKSFSRGLWGPYNLPAECKAAAEGVLGRWVVSALGRLGGGSRDKTIRSIPGGLREQPDLGPGELFRGCEVRWPSFCKPAFMSGIWPMGPEWSRLQAGGCPCNTEGSLRNMGLPEMLAPSLMFPIWGVYGLKEQGPVIF